MEAFAESLKSLAAKDEAGRKKILDGLRDLQYAIETPEDTITRITFYGLRLSMVRLGIDLKLFEILAAEGKPITSAELAERTGCAPTLMARILRYLASEAFVKETARDTFTSTNVTQTLSYPGMQAGVHHYFDNLGPVFQALPDFLRDTKYADITENTNTPFQKAWATTEPAFVWAQSHPEHFKNFNQWMATQRHGMPTWLDVYPVEEEAKESLSNSEVQSGQAGEEERERVLLVDVGGGIGHQAVAFRDKYNGLKGRVVLEDIPQTLEHAIQHPGVEVVVQDFFQPQAIQGAKYYYLRNILHDYPDSKCIHILRNLIDALGPDSRILIDEMVLPNKGVNWQATQLDMTMMSSLAAQERTTDEWESLLDRAGLKVVRMETYTVSLRDTVIACVPKWKEAGEEEVNGVNGLSGLNRPNSTSGDVTGVENGVNGLRV